LPSAETTLASNAPEKKETTEADHSLQLLTGPPASLRDNPPPSPPTTAEAQPRLTSAEVTELADGSTRSHGLNPAELQRGQPQFIAKDETWSVGYASSSGGETITSFSVTVDDKTKGTVFVPAK
jgi:hypothetical protein